MLNDSHLENWFGLPVNSASPDTEFDAEGAIYRFGYNYDDEGNPVELLEQFLTSPGVGQTVAIVSGMDDEGGSDTTQNRFLDVLETHKQRLPNLCGLFLGDITQEENEMSWIKQDDISRALRIFPDLIELRARGQDGLRFEPCRHNSLAKLVIETGGMPKGVLHGIAASEFPELTHLELWLGTDEYGFDGGIDDILPLLNPGLFPNLTHLTLGNSSIQNEIALAVADAPILDQLESLDLSLGVMDDSGGAALLNSARVRRLKKLNLYRNYLSPKMAADLSRMGPEVRVDDQETKDEYGPYVAVGE